MTPLEHRIWAIIEPAVADEGVRLVRVLLSGEGGGQTLQVMIEPEEAGPDCQTSVTLDQCQAVSRQISALMDVEDPIASQYRLEVSSTGLERPLVTARDFEVYTGKDAKVELHDAVGGQKRFVGTVAGSKGEVACLKPADGEAIEFDVNNIKKAKLVISDAEMKNLMRAS